MRTMRSSGTPCPRRPVRSTGTFPPVSDPVAGAYYNWSSPLVVTDPADGHPTPTSALPVCVTPTHPGQLLKVSLTTHPVVGTTTMVPPARSVVASGHRQRTTDNQQDLRLDGNTQPLLANALPGRCGDKRHDDGGRGSLAASLRGGGERLDWGTTPTLTTDANGDQIVSLANKNGILYTLNRNNMAAGPGLAEARSPTAEIARPAAMARSPRAPSPTVSCTTRRQQQRCQRHRSRWIGDRLQPRHRSGALEARDQLAGSRLDHRGQRCGLRRPGPMIEALNATTGASLWTTTSGPGRTGRRDSQRHAVPGRAQRGVLRIRPAGDAAADRRHPIPTARPDSPARTSASLAFPAASMSTPTAASLSPRRETGGPRAIKCGSSPSPATGDFQNSRPGHVRNAGQPHGYQQPQLGIVIRQSAALGAPFYTALQDPTYPAEGENVANVIMYYRASWGGRSSS